MFQFSTFIRLAIPLVIIITSFGFGFIFERRILKKFIQKGTRRKWQSYTLIFQSLRGIAFLWFVLAGCFLTLPTFPFKPGIIIIIQKTLLAIFLISVTLFVSRLSVGFIRLYSLKTESSSPLTSLFENITRLIIFSLGLLIILQSIGIAITPLLTAIGVGGVSVGLALQNTLSNLFSGINILTSKKIRLGDYLELKSGEEGYVTDIAWKYTTIKDITDNLLVIPNDKIVSASFKNYSLPEKQLLIPIKVGISYDSDLEKVEKITLEVAKETLEKVLGGVPDYQPFMRYSKFDYYSINFTVYLKVQEYYDQLIIRHEFIKRLHERYRREKIKIPFPLKAAYLPAQNRENSSDRDQ